MVHNGIEYGIMQAYAEGFDIFKNATSKDLPADIRYDLNLPDIAEVWRRGSVMSSWLLDLTAMALAENPTLSEYSGFVEDSGEGRWTIQAAIEEAVPAEVLTAALFARFRSRQDHTFAEKMLSAMRQKFGGHVELKPPRKRLKERPLRAASELSVCSEPQLEANKRGMMAQTEVLPAPVKPRAGASRSLRHGDLRLLRRPDAPQADSRSLQSREPAIALARIRRHRRGPHSHEQRGRAQKATRRFQEVCHRSYRCQVLGLICPAIYYMSRRFRRSGTYDI